MKRSPVSPLNKALYERLTGALSVGIYDYVPQGKKAPYVVLTETSAQAWDAKTFGGADVLATVKVLSEYQGDKEVAAICDAAILAVLANPLVLSGFWQIARASVDSHSIERLDTHREGTIVFRFMILDTEE